MILWLRDLLVEHPQGVKPLEWYDELARRMGARGKDLEGLRCHAQLTGEAGLHQESARALWLYSLFEAAHQAG